MNKLEHELPILPGADKMTRIIERTQKMPHFDKQKVNVEDDGIELMIARKEHREGILHLLQFEFIPREPVQMTLGVTWEEVEDTMAWVVDDALTQPCTLVAVHPKEGVVGCAISKFLLIDPTRPHNPDDMYNVKGDSAKLLIFQHIIDRTTFGWKGTFAKHGFSTALLLVDLSIHSGFGGRGLAQLLIQENMKIAKRLRANCVFAYATNQVSQHAFDKAGYEIWRSVEYESVKSPENGKPYVVPKEGTKSMQWMVKTLQQE